MPRAAALDYAIARGIATVRKAGKAAGSLSSNPLIAREYLSMGANFLAVGVDTSLLVKTATELAAAFKAMQPLHSVRLQFTEWAKVAGNEDLR